MRDVWEHIGLALLRTSQPEQVAAYLTAVERTWAA
ncbi:hypothetical protein JOF45_000384 [Nesterenkonia lacusekhoensis]|uniref:Uncharacterized protein n=1 Tax=Nesterenkonia lacusekhoensis TaxID=150832 RepID=A0ABS4SYU6_9MICC|nr:hypothetical protein [Nesterenkonia lacusekhoensis]